MRRIVVGVVIVIVIVWIVGSLNGEDDTATPQSTPPRRAAPTTTAAPSIGYKVAVIDGENPSGESDVSVILLNGLLREIARRCADADAEGVADYAVTARRLLKEDYGREVTVYTVLTGLDAGTAGQTGLNCAEIAAAFVTIAGR